MTNDIKIYSQLLDTAPSNIVLCRGSQLKYSLKQLTRTTPLANKFMLAEAQTTGFENPRLVLTGYIDTNSLTSSTLDQRDMLKLLKTPYDGTSATEVRLYVETGNSSVPLYGFDGTTSYLKVVVDNIDVSIDPSNTRNGQIWVYTMNLTETL